MKTKEWYDPSLLPLAEDSLLRALRDEGEISDNEVAAAKYRRLTAHVSADPVSRRYLEYKAEKERREKLQTQGT